MTSLDFPFSLMLRFSIFIFVFVLCFMKKSYAFEDGKLVNSNGSHFHTVDISSLLPRGVCNSSIIKGSNKRLSTMEVFHKHGPCSHKHSSKTAATTPSLSEVLSRDQSRVESIQARLNPDSDTNTDTNINTMKKTDSKPWKPKKGNQAMLSDARYGSRSGSGNYIVAVGLGTPRRTMSLEFDTGSALTWTQCEPCLRSCYDQQDPIFDPSGSTSYANLSCSSAECSQLAAATRIQPICDDGTCVYEARYGDGSYTSGYLSRDKLALSASDVIPNFVFGCGQENKLIGNDAGILGLARGSLSIVYQTTQKYGAYFSYCLPATPSSTGYLALGKTRAPTRAKFTPLKGTTYYVIDIISITVGGRRLQIKISVFKAAGGIIDSGTVITRLPPAAYSAMSAAFDEAMRTKYTRVEAYSILDTCYDISGYETISIPTVSFTFSGNVRVDLDPSGIVVVVRTSSQVCLAFAGNRDAGDVAIYGNVQQRTFEVVYDVAGGKLGFAPGGCN